MKQKPSPQHAPAAALLELISEHPELPPLRWSLCPDGMLMATTMHMDVDVRPVMRAYMDVLGGTHTTDSMYELADGDEPQFSSWLYVTWRDVPLSITLGCPLRLTGVSVVEGLPTAWIAKVTS